ncbi:MAG: hypothetical protein AAGB32_02285 [Pseudomonadota bacterium]
MLHKTPLQTMPKKSAPSKIRPVTDEDLEFLQEKLDAHKTQDPYQKSANYYAMTGRNGLWMIEEGDSTVIICQHPNDADIKLIFPVIGMKNERLLLKTISALKQTNTDYRFARFENLPFEERRYPIQAIKEDILDWTFPVYTIDCALISQHEGKNFGKFRQKLNRIDTTNIQAMDLDANHHEKDVLSVLDEWSPQGQKRVYYRLLNLMRKNRNLKGRIVFEGDTPIGFSIFEVATNRVANAFAHIGLHRYGGASQYVMKDMCQTLLQNDIKQVCIGGSENEGLDRFKKELAPIETTYLQSWAEAVARQETAPKVVNLH